MAKKLPLGIELAKGFTRMVIVIGPWAIKMPLLPLLQKKIASSRYRWWRRWFWGVEGNRTEARVWKESQGQAHDLCPVLWSGFWGLILVMPRCQILTDEQWELEDLNNEVAFSFYTDNQPYNFGYLDGRVVQVDYAGPY